MVESGSASAYGNVGFRNMFQARCFGESSIVNRYFSRLIDAASHEIRRVLDIHGFANMESNSTYSEAFANILDLSLLRSSLQIPYGTAGPSTVWQTFS